MSFDDLLIAIIIAGTGLSGAYLGAKYVSRSLDRDHHRRHRPLGRLPRRQIRIVAQIQGRRAKTRIQPARVVRQSFVR